MAIIKILEQQILPTIKGCISNDRASQKRLYFSFYGFAASVCQKYIWKDDVLEEVINDGFLKVFKGLATFIVPDSHAENALKAWMRRIMVNTAIDRLRKDKQLLLQEANAISEALIETFPAPNQQDTLSYKELMQYINKLSPAYRLVFSLHVLDGLTHDEIAGLLNITSGASKSNLSKARMHLKRMITVAGQTNENYAERAV